MGQSYMRFARAHIRERDINELEGVIRGIALDGRINDAELVALRRWYSEMRSRMTKNHWDALDCIERAIGDGLLDDEERGELLWVCDRLRASTERFDETTQSMQVLHGIMAGLAADGVINETELSELRAWLEAAEHLKGRWPYDEIDSLVTAAMADGRIDSDEHRFLLAFSSQFLDRENDLLTEGLSEDLLKHGICAVQPVVVFEGRKFVVTGDSARASRKEIHGHIESRGGLAHPRVTKEVDFVIVAAAGNPAWAFSCYGRKIEAAVHLRRQGGRVALVHESDFWDALADAPLVRR